MLRHALRPDHPDGRKPFRLSFASLLGALAVVAAALVASVVPAPAGPLSLSRTVPVAMSNQDMSQRAERHPYYARKLGHRMAEDFGYKRDRQWHCLRRLWNLESSWRVHADNPSSSAYGIPQANPGKKMSSAGGHWKSNATTQIRWGLRYVHGRYSHPCGAMRHKSRYGWY
jgi:hypothetical protein